MVVSFVLLSGICIHNLSNTSVSEKICKAREDRINLDTVYLHFAKAFDKADYGIAAHRIKELSIGGELSVWLVNNLLLRPGTNGRKVTYSRLQ